MKKVIKILESEIRVRQEMVDMYDKYPDNQAITEFTANTAKELIKELETAIKILAVTYK